MELTLDQLKRLRLAVWFRSAFVTDDKPHYAEDDDILHILDAEIKAIETKLYPDGNVPKDQKCYYVQQKKKKLGRHTYRASWEKV